jgi:hypothetical protein
MPELSISWANRCSEGVRTDPGEPGHEAASLEDVRDAVGGDLAPSTEPQLGSLSVAVDPPLAEIAIDCERSPGAEGDRPRPAASPAISLRRAPESSRVRISAASRRSANVFPSLARSSALTASSRRTGTGSSESGEWSRHSDLNRGPAVYETAALPLSYVGADQE